MSFPPETNDGEVTSWIPLTTTFTPTTGCESFYRLNGPSLVAFDPGYGLDIDSEVKCAPSAVTTWWEQGRLGGGWSEHTAVSIMPLACPDRWSTVATSIKNKISTQAMCCPSGYYLANGVPGSISGDCLSDVKGGVTLTYASTAATATRDWRIRTTTLTGSSHVGAIAVVGWNVARAAYSATQTAASFSSVSSPTSPTVVLSSSIPNTIAASSGQSLARSSSLLPSSTSAETTSSSALPTEATAAAADSSPSDGISVGFKVGIGLGVSLGVIGVVALVIAMVMLRQRSRHAFANERARETAAAARTESKHIPLRHFSEAERRIYELPNEDVDPYNPQVAELPGSHSPAELETSYHKDRK